MVSHWGAHNNLLFLGFLFGISSVQWRLLALMFPCAGCYDRTNQVLDFTASRLLYLQKKSKGKLSEPRLVL